MVLIHLHGTQKGFRIHLIDGFIDWMPGWMVLAPLLMIFSLSPGPLRLAFPVSE